MAIDLELVNLPNAIATGICLDCDTTRFVTRAGACVTCGSKSVIRQGALKELARLGVRTGDAPPPVPPPPPPPPAKKQGRGRRGRADATR